MGGSLSSGAKGIDNFEQNIAIGNLPPESSIEYEGVFYNYYFKTPKTDKLFDISLSYCITPDPLSQIPEHYMSIGLGSRLDGDGLYKYAARPTLNLVICLDISGSMSQSFLDPQSPPKLTVAINSLLVLLNRLRPDDMFGLVTFDTQAQIVHDLQPWKQTDVASLKEKILALKTQGGTDVTVGMEAAANMCKTYGSHDNQNRIIFLTDLLVNSGSSDDDTLYNLTKKYIDEKIYFTYFGVGADFNSVLVSKLSKLRQTNYLSVKTSKDFKRKMEEEFDYLVTPCVFDVTVSFNTKAWSVERVYGSPGFEYPGEGKLAQMDSIFPTPEDKENPGMTMGGIILIKLRKLQESSEPIQFKLEYVDASNNKFTEDYTVTIPNWEGEKFEDTSIQKGVALARFVNFMKHYLRNPTTPEISLESGLTIPVAMTTQQNKNTQKISNLSAEWEILFERFANYFSAQLEKIGDKRMEKELHNLETFRKGTVPN